LIIQNGLHDTDKPKFVQIIDAKIHLRFKTKESSNYKVEITIF